MNPFLSPLNLRCNKFWQSQVMGKGILRLQVAVILLWLLLACLPTRTYGQRAVVSLKSRLQRTRNGSTRTDNEDDIVIQNDHVQAMGGLEQVDLAWQQIQMTLETSGKKSPKEKLLLDGSQRGRARPGRLLAIMGPSGAGKSTLLHALAGRVKDNPKLKLQGRRYINGVELDGSSLVPAAFIEQEVNFFPHMTVRETLQFRVELKLGSRLSKSARDDMVQDLLDQLGLAKVADSIVGNASVRGISGGERKRLSIAVEMISAPAVIFLDEPTSGLDATAATKLVQTLRKLADSGKTVIAVIHQPSQHVFAAFDDLILLSDGRLMYYGERKDVRSYMSIHGAPAPSEMGTAEHILDCISTDPMEGESEEQAKQRIERLASKAATSDLNLGKLPAENGNSKSIQHFESGLRRGPRASIITQFKLLLQRSVREITRGKLVIFIKFVQQVSTALIYGGIYSLGTNQASIQDRFGLLSLIAIGSSNMAVAAAIRAFPREKAIVSNELASKMYRTLPYFVGKALSEIPLVAFFSFLFGSITYRLTGLSRAVGKFRKFSTLLFTHGLVSEGMGLLIGALSPNSDVALSVFPAILVLNIIFDGRNISEENTPRLLRWIPKLGLIRWGFEGLCINEFDGLKFDTSGPRRGPVAKTGVEALDRFGLGSRGLGDVFQAQMLITGSFWLLSYLGLTLTRQRFLEMKEPENKDDAK